MGKRISILIAVTMLLTTGFQQAKRKNDRTSWIEFSQERGAFSLMFPDKPTERFFPHNTEKGPTRSPLYEVTKDDIKYSFTYMDYPFSVEEKERDKLLDMGAEAGITQVGGKVVSNAAISLNGYPGREVKGEMQGIVYRSRVYLVGQRIYFMIVWLPSSQPMSENATKFLESFKLKVQ